MAIVSYLNFRGNAREAVLYYQEKLEGKELVISTFADLPQDPEHPFGEEEQKLIANASIKIAGGLLMFSDTPDSMADQFQMGNNISLSILDKDPAVIKKYFEALAPEGQVVMPLMEAPWSPAYGMLVDKFGVNWQMNCTADDYYYTV